MFPARVPHFLGIVEHSSLFKNSVLGTIDLEIKFSYEIPFTIKGVLKKTWWYASQFEVDR